MAFALQAITRGLAVLQSGHGETYRFADSTTFTAWRGTKERQIADVGTVIDTTLATTDALASLPAEGAIITHVDSAITFRVISAEGQPPGRIVITVTAEPR